MFQLHERLAADTHKLGESRLCDVLLMNDNTWPWVILVPRISGIREIYELPNEQQQRRGELPWARRLSVKSLGKS